MKNRIYSYVLRINEHYNKTKEIVNSVKSIDDLDFFSIMGDSFLFHFFQIGELFSRMTKDYPLDLNERDVKGVIDIRNFIVHGYGELNIPILKKSYVYSLPRLIKEMNEKAALLYKESLFHFIHKRIDLHSFKGEYFFIDEVVAPNGQFQRCHLIGSNGNFADTKAVVVGLVQKIKGDYILLVSYSNTNLKKEEIVAIIKDIEELNGYKLVA